MLPDGTRDEGGPMIDKLEMLIALARERHFGRAAEICHVTQPSLSSAIRALESLYGVPLVHRGARFNGLTPEGERLLIRARTIVAEAHAIRSDLAQLRAEPAGPLRLGVIPTALTAAQLLTGPFLARNPGVSLSLRSMTSQDILEALADFRIDAGLSYDTDDAGRAPAGGFDVIPLFDEHYALLRHAEATPAEPGWSDLATLRLCLLTPDMQNRRMLDRNLARLGVTLRPVVEASSILALVAHVQADPGLATVLPAHLASFFAGLPGLRSQPVAGSAGLTVPRVALIVPPEGRRSPAVADLVRRLPPIDASYRLTEH